MSQEQRKVDSTGAPAQQHRRPTGQQPAAQTGQFIRLNSDENPYGCSLNVQDALAASSDYHLPADPVALELRTALGRYTGFAPERIAVGAGTAELTERLLHGFLDPGDAVITCPPSLPQPTL